ncbi:ERF family protein [Mycolicibacterium neoaurum]|uniref:ERF family protein n=1 Tax=Mycolicibacterium neoaurum TaxID=1795 RepID=UPI001F4CB03E|nr:ERF family protein [Mycolicibacterium neoaurum]
MTAKEETQSSLAGALVQFQGKVPTIAKTQTAKVTMKSGGSFSYSYADLGDIWDAIRPALSECKLAVTQALVGGSDGWTSIKTTIWHESGEKYSESLQVPTGDKTAQEAGSQFTYFKRYALAAALGIATDEDDDGQAGNAKPTAPVVTKSATELDEQALARAKKAINTAMEDQGFDTVAAKMALIRSVVGHETIDNLNEADRVADKLGMEP